MQNSHPEYELLAKNPGSGGLEISVWQIPCAASPHLAARKRIAGLKGRNYSIGEAAILKMLRQAGVALAPPPGSAQKYALDEDTALNLGLLCKMLAPMRNAQRMREVVAGIGQMKQPEAAYWLGMAMYRKNPRRVLSALRLLLTDPASA